MKQHSTFHDQANTPNGKKEYNGKCVAILSHMVVTILSKE